MAKLSRRMRAIAQKIDAEKAYEIDEAVTLLNGLAGSKFKDSFDAIQAEMGKKTRIRMEKKKNAYLVQATDTGTIITTCRSFKKRR